jgi:type II secretory pathway pseudopilin PulG
MSFIKSIAGELLIGLLTILAALALGYSQGSKHTDQKWQAKEAATLKTAQKEYQDEVERGQKAAGNYLASAQALTGQFNQLQEKFNVLRKRTPLVVGGGRMACPGINLGVRPGGPSLADGRAGATPEQPGSGNAGDDASGVPVLTAGAVWVWNSALTGADQPANACGAADPTAAACAAATSSTIDDAWDNHIANAKACAANRLAHQRLIDFVTTSNLRKTAP